MPIWWPVFAVIRTVRWCIRNLFTLKGFLSVFVIAWLLLLFSGVDTNAPGQDWRDVSEAVVDRYQQLAQDSINDVSAWVDSLGDETQTAKTGGAAAVKTARRPKPQASGTKAGDSSRQATASSVDSLTQKILYMQKRLQTLGYPVQPTGSFDRNTRRQAFLYLTEEQAMRVQESQPVQAYYEAFRATER